MLLLFGFQAAFCVSGCFCFTACVAEPHTLRYLCFQFVGRALMPDMFQIGRRLSGINARPTLLQSRHSRAGGNLGWGSGGGWLLLSPSPALRGRVGVGVGVSAETLFFRWRVWRAFLLRCRPYPSPPPQAGEGMMLLWFLRFQLCSLGLDPTWFSVRHGCWVCNPTYLAAFGFSAPSFPRRRESWLRRAAVGVGRLCCCAAKIPACAGMTADIFLLPVFVGHKCPTYSLMTAV